MRSPGGRLRRVGYAIYYGLPFPVRRRLVRLAMARYVVGAVALVRDSEDTGAGSLLLLRQPPGVGWSLPAGLLKRGEPPIVGCARELREESGLDLGADGLTPAMPNAVVHSRGGWVDMVFEAAVPASTAKLTADGIEVLEARFHPLNNLPPLTSATARLLSYYDIGPYAGYPEIQS